MNARGLSLMAGLLAVSCSSERQVPIETTGPLVAIEHPGLERESTRNPRRLSHLQLRRSVESLMGTKWMEDGLDVLFGLGPTLGDPDYGEVTEENLDASPLYVKFMEDLANGVCAEAPDGMLQPRATAAENVSAIKLRLHGEYVPPGDPALAPLIVLEQRAGMRAVCVALLGAPEFFLY